MSVDLTRRELCKAVGAGLAIAGPAPPAIARAQEDADQEGANPAGDALKLWYRKPATRWVEALPPGTGRLGAMVRGGIEHERLQLNEDTLHAGSPYDAISPEALEALPEVRRLIFAGEHAQAEALADAKMMSRPLKQMPYAPLAILVLDIRDVPDTSEYRREKARACAPVQRQGRRLRAGLRHANPGPVPASRAGGRSRPARRQVGAAMNRLGSAA